MSKNIELVYAWFEEIWNQGNEAAIDKYFAADGMAYGISPIPLNREGFKQYHRSFRQAFPNMQIGVLETMEQGDRVSYYCIGILDKDEEPPKTVLGMGFVSLRDGQVVEATNIWDFLHLLVEMGELPENALANSLASYSMKPVA